MGRTRRSKKRSHVEEEEGGNKKTTPHTFVMERGRVGRTLSQLVLDMRRVMEPHTASKLKVRQKNVLMDFVQVAGPLGVTHFMIVSRTDSHINLRLCCLPRGPTITFHVNNFSLTRDVTSSIRRPVTSLTQFMTAPLLILNNFSSDDKLSKLMATMFQNMFPSLNVQTVKLGNINRCVLFNYDADTRTIEFRHYNIRVVARGISRSVKRLGKPSVPNLSKFDDISDYMLGGYVSESEGEEVTAQEVTLPQDLPGRGNTQSSRSAVRLTELGPRLTLHLVKIEAGLCKGEVLHHEFIHKSKREAHDIHRRVVVRERLRQERKRQQEVNVTRKKREKEQHKLRCLEGQRLREGTNEDKESDSEGEDDREWYRQEVGEEPDPDMLIPSHTHPRKRKGRGISRPVKKHCDATRGRGGGRGQGGGRGGGRGRGDKSPMSQQRSDGERGDRWRGDRWRGERGRGVGREKVRAARGKFASKRSQYSGRQNGTMPGKTVRKRTK